LEKPLTRSILGVTIAIAITTTMDAAGLTIFSALPLFPLMALLWYLDKMPRRDMGFTWGRWSHHAVAVLYPVVVLGTGALIAAVAGAVDISKTDWSKVRLEVALVMISTILVAILTEEGFFRGWLWASLQRAAVTPERTLIWTSLAFSLWHLSWVALDTGFDLPWRQIPVFMVNAAILGGVWGVLRWRSGSVGVSSLSHGVWNGLAYVFFGSGTTTGALGIENTALFGPEVGLLGLAINAAFFIALRWGWKANTSKAP
jgi:membrane protease YdiL (CAAX protease family)